MGIRHIRLFKGPASNIFGQRYQHEGSGGGGGGGGVRRGKLGGGVRSKNSYPIYLYLSRQKPAIFPTLLMT